MTSLRRRIAICLAAVAVAGGLVLAGVTPAAAGTVTQRWLCGSITGGTSYGNFHVTITAPATASVGQTATVTAAVTAAVNQSNTIAAGVIRASLVINLGGVGSGTITATGLTNPDILPGTPWRVAGGRAQITFTRAGDVTFRTSHLDGGAWGCGAATDPQPIVAVTRVS